MPLNDTRLRNLEPAPERPSAGSLTARACTSESGPASAKSPGLGNFAAGKGARWRSRPSASTRTADPGRAATGPRAGGQGKVVQPDVDVAAEQWQSEQIDYTHRKAELIRREGTTGVTIGIVRVRARVEVDR